MKAFFKAAIVMILVAEASFLLKRKKPKVVAVTGSVGKTTTKDAVFAAIKNNVYTRKSEKSFNSEIGIPLTILGLPNAWNNPLGWFKNIIEGFFIAFFSRSYPEVLVLEAGIDRPGDMEKLVRWLRPDIVVLTKLPDIPVHVEYFSSPAEVVEEKMKLVTALKPDGVLIYNHDDMTITSQLDTVMQKKIGFGREIETDFTARLDRVVYQDDQPVGTEFILHHQDNEYVIHIADTIGVQYTYACSAAVAVADELCVPIEAAVVSLQSFRTPNGRMRLLAGMKSTLIIDDTYNASPVATEYALLALQELNYASRKIAVLGDMLELGKYSTDEHRKVGSMVARSAQILFAVGVRAQMIAEGALTAGMSEKHIFQYDDAMRAGRELQAILTPGDVVLVKASQGIRAERIVEEVMANPEQAEELLVRQEKAWRSIA